MRVIKVIVQERAAEHFKENFPITTRGLDNDDIRRWYSAIMYALYAQYLFDKYVIDKDEKP